VKLPADAAIVDELTPVPCLGPTVSPIEAELAVARSTCERQRLALAAMQARIDELEAREKQLHDDRRTLAARVAVLEKKLKEKKQ